MNAEALFRLSYGMYVVSSRRREQPNGQIANTMFQVTAEPPTVAVSINKQNLTHEFIRESGVFSVSVLSQETPLEFIGRFGFKSGRDSAKFDGIVYKAGMTGVPVVLEYTLAYLEAKVVDRVDVGTHTVFIGKVVAAEVVADGEPMTYAYYHAVKRGRAPKTAPTYAGPETKETEREAKQMEKYRCTVCGYVYDPAVGDPDSGIEPGTSFGDLPEDWICPVCGVGKDEFEKVV